MSKESVLIVEDDPDIVELLQYNLERAGFRVITAQDGESGLREARTRQPNAIFLDLMLPGVDGLQVCRQLKEQEATRAIPVIMITAKGEEGDIVLGLELGADDYIPKPFSPREVVARLRAVLRRGRDKERGAPTRIEMGSVVLDAERHEVLVDGQELPFTRAEFRLLWKLASRPGRVFSRDELVDGITGGEAYILDRNVDVHVSSIRKKLGTEAGIIATVRGVGYKCKD